ncbi:MAG: hypothetical protein ABI480_06705 [Chitinophagaceae bacterium]
MAAHSGSPFLLNTDGTDNKDPIAIGFKDLSFLLYEIYMSSYVHMISHLMMDEEN